MDDSYANVCGVWLQQTVREPGIEPGPTPWQGAILPLDHSRTPPDVDLVAHWHSHYFCAGIQQEGGGSRVPQLQRS